MTGYPLTAVAETVKSGSTCTVRINGTATTVEVVRDLTVAIGDVLLIHKVGSLRVASGRLYAAALAEVPGEPDPPPEPKPAIVTGRLVVPAVFTGSYRDSRWRTDTGDVVQGAYGGYGNSTGVAFYGTKPTSLAGATVTAASVNVKRAAGGAYAAQATTLRLVTEDTQPIGAPTLTSTTAGPNLAVGATDASFTVPTAWAQAMVDGTAGGLALFDGDGSPYARYAGRGAYSASFTLTINWQRTT
jgi:hypothetical protein